MHWSPQQDRALVEVSRWMSARDRARPFFYLGGYAGTGKTTLAKELAPPGSLFGAYTGKAASVMRSVGCAGATTLHALMYQPKDKTRAHLLKLEGERDAMLARRRRETIDEDALMMLQAAIVAERENLKRPSFTLNSESPLKDAPALVIDEVSMVDDPMGQDALSFGVPILVLGDPAQLPPIRGAGFFTARAPDIMLTEVHRQALDSPVLRMATEVRQGGRLSAGDYGDSWVRSTVPPEEALAADQLAVGLNLTRRATNRRVRELKGLQGPLPKTGERLVCLSNEHELGLLNGVTYRVNRDAAGLDGGPITLSITPEGEEPPRVIETSAHREFFVGDPDDIQPWDRRLASSFDYAYAMTVHKLQGSGFSTGIVFDEWLRDGHQAWLYTALTRFKHKVGVVRK